MKREIETEVSKNIRRIFISVSILWLGYLFIGIMVAGIWWILSDRMKDPIIKGISSEFLPQLRNILIGIGVIEIVVGLWLKNKFMESLTGGKDLNLQRIAKSYAQAHLIPSALALSISFYGLIMGLSGGDKNSVLLMFIISFFGLWLFQPKIKKLQSLVRQY
ncbi:MAG: hypothetical protein N2260_06655 [Syntrophobacterales bacterium]|nr:hypothetical protein [Syntrophobacterales bacterium]